jgi:hypothetical protein
MIYLLFADALVVVHFAIVLFILFGQAAILVGAARGWRWIRNLRFRLAHLAAIVVVAFQAVFGVLCPLTVWENDLLQLAGHAGRPGTFVGRIVRSMLYYDFPLWVFAITYAAFALLVIATLVLVPPRRGGSRT